MIDREKVICGLLSCKNHRCAECPYNGIPCITGLLSDALALLREQEPRVMTVDTAILDATCGDRTIWFQKDEPHTVYCDKRREEWEGDFGTTLRADGKKKHRHLVINPDVQCDFTALPFENGSFYLVVFDPPHIVNLSDTSWMRKSYGSLDGDWKTMIHDGFAECMRVLKPYGTLIFKWSDISVSTRDIINVIGHEPLFGHRSGRKMNTHWMTFMKFPEQMRETKWEGDSDA